MKHIKEQSEKMRGFTLVEMLIVIVILSILATVAVPLLTAADGFKSSAIAERILDVLAHVRLEAVKLGKPVTVHFHEGSDAEVHVIEIDGLDPLPTEPGGYVVDLPAEYKTAVILTTTGFSNSQVTFRSDGSVVDVVSGALISMDATIVNTVGEHSTTIKINPITGLGAIIKQ